LISEHQPNLRRHFSVATFPKRDAKYIRMQNHEGSGKATSAPIAPKV